MHLYMQKSDKNTSVLYVWPYNMTSLCFKGIILEWLKWASVKMMAQGDKLLGFIAWLQNKKLCRSYAKVFLILQLWWLVPGLVLC